MAAQLPTRFDDLLLDAVHAIQEMGGAGKGWEGADPEQKGRAVELVRGLAGERRYAKQMGDAELLGRIERLEESSQAQLRMLEGRTTSGDEDLAGRLDSDVTSYSTAPRAAETGEKTEKT